MPNADVDLALAAPPDELVRRLSRLPEDQWFERKSARIEPRKLAETLVAMANADGGRVIVGLHNGVAEDVSSRLNDLLQTSKDHTEPAVWARWREVESETESGRAATLLLLDIEPSDRMHYTRDGRCFLRVGDENRRLTTHEQRELEYDKGSAKFETSRVAGASTDDLDGALLANYSRRIGSTDPFGVLEDRTLSRPPDQLTASAVLLFAERPQRYFPNAFVRVSRFKGTVREAGRQLNLIEDVRCEGPIPRVITAARDAIRRLQPKRWALTDMGEFGEVATVPEDAWLEGLVNAVVHRSYSLEGDHIHVDIFDNRIEIFSPGRFPHIVELADPTSIRRYARNPRIVRVCFDLKLCQEMGEGIRRIFGEMRRAMLQDPLYRQDMSGVTLTLASAPMNAELDRRFPRGIREIVQALRSNKRMSTADLVDVVGLSRPAVRARLDALRDAGIVEWYGKSPKDPRAYWYLTDEHTPPV